MDPYNLDVLAIRSAVEASKFGKMSRFIMVTTMDNVTTTEVVGNFSAHAMKWSLDNRNSGLPRGFGGSLFSVPTVVSDTFSEEVKVWVGKNRPPRHFSAMEFPVLVSVPDRQIYYYTKTPIWGAAYYRGFRKFVREVFDFSTSGPSTAG